MAERDERSTAAARCAGAAECRRTTSTPRSPCSARCCCPATPSARSPSWACRSSDFYKPAHQHVFEAIRVLATGEPVDAVTVAEELRRTGLLDAIGGAELLVDLQAATPAISNAARYARIVQDTALLRRLIGVAGEIAELGYDEPDDVTKALDVAESKVFELAEHRVIDSTKPVGDLLKLAIDDLRSLDRGDAITGTGHRLQRPRRAAVGPAALHAQRRRRPARHGQVRRRGTPRCRPGHRRARHAPPSCTGAGVAGQVGRLPRPARRAAGRGHAVGLRRRRRQAGVPGPHPVGRSVRTHR